MPLKTVQAEGVPQAWPEYPLAVRGGGFVFVSGTRGGRPDGQAGSFSDVPSVLSKNSQGFWLVDEQEGDATSDAWNAHARMDTILRAAGTQSDQILRQRMWQKDKRFFPVLERVRKFCQPEAAPSSGLGVSSVGGRFGRWYGIESIAVDPEHPNYLGPRRVLTPALHAANPSASIYSQMVASGPLVFLAGHIPIRTAEPRKPVVASFDDIPEQGRFLATGRSHPDARDGPIAAQTWFVYNEIQRALESNEMSMRDIVHVRVYLSDLRDLATFHRVHTHFFASSAPAMTIVGFDEVGHKGCRIEIEPTALLPGRLQRTDVSWNCGRPYSGPAACRAGPLLFFAGMLGIDSKGCIATSADSVGTEVEFIRSLEDASSSPSLPAQVWWAWRRLLDTCEASGLGIDCIAKTVVYLRGESDVAVYEAIRSKLHPHAQPAFDCVFVQNPGPIESVAVQIDATAVHCD